jgi:hypothetical protein
VIDIPFLFFFLFHLFLLLFLITHHHYIPYSIVHIFKSEFCGLLFSFVLSHSVQFLFVFVYSSSALVFNNNSIDISTFVIERFLNKNQRLASPFSDRCLISSCHKEFFQQQQRRHMPTAMSMKSSSRVYWIWVFKEILPDRFSLVRLSLSLDVCLLQALIIVHNRSLEDALAIVFGETPFFSTDLAVQTTNAARVEQSTQIPYQSVGENGSNRL